MSDRRRWPANARVAAEELRGRVDGVRLVSGEHRIVARPVLDLLDAPEGRRDRQVLYGEAVRVLEERAGWAFVESVKDGYTGYLRADGLGRDDSSRDHRCTAPWTLAYEAPHAKAMARARYPMGACFTVAEVENGWAMTEAGYIPAGHLRPRAAVEPDPVAVAERLLGMPYLWGGNGYDGIDCSGLVQTACTLCGIACPGDSDMQAAELGEPLDPGAPLQRGDVMFWKGHVAFVADDRRILHANGHSMSVAFEDREAAIARIIAAGDGPVTECRRIPVAAVAKEETSF